jgi:valyl-tRNA synthetase
MSDQEEILAKPYDPETIEKTWYDFWHKKGYFRPEFRPDGTPYTITIPPPNVTGELHMGHALQHAIHDSVIRFKRMQGFRTLCLPGTDHAGIGTQMKVEQQIWETEKKTRHDIGRTELLKRIWAWKEKYGSTILQQLRDLGCSYDWSRERFTMDEGYARAVLETFVRFYEKGWIYRGKRMVNWCPQCGTVISDLEVEEKEIQSHLWHIRYPGVDGAPDVVVATTRPETMLGDTGVAVHPTDARWQDAIGKQVMLPLMNRAIPIVADEYADPEMGSGAVKVTPAHDPNDNEVGKRHNLAEILVIGLDGTMTEDAGAYAGQDRYVCRKGVVAALEELGLLVKIDDHNHAVPHHDRCGTVIEPLPMEQWFVSMRDLADLILPVLREKQIEYVPDRFREYSIDWLENIRDWCISRQLWWGHRIPVWTCEDCNEVIVSVDSPEVCTACGSQKLIQDPDVLDTWFSSALWPFATMGWPDETEDLKAHRPTDLMITGRDILYLWVIRMIMTAEEFLGEIPFKTVLVHPTVQTRDGKRMSKSLGTGIDPRELIARYGADATRLSLLYQCGSSQDIRFDAEVKDNKLEESPIAEMCRNFCNKIWNAARFVQMNMDERDIQDPALRTLPEGISDLADRWILSLYNRTVKQVTHSLETYRFDEAARGLYEFVWSAYCDWYVEMAKVRLNGDDAKAREQVQSILCVVFEGTLRLMHPIAPFISEALWQTFPHEGEALIIASWPESNEAWLDEAAEREMAQLQEVVGAVRNIRGTMRIPPGKRVDVVFKTVSEDATAILLAAQNYMKELGRIENMTIGADVERPSQSASAVVGDIEIFVPLAGVIDLDVERQRLEKEIVGLEKALGGLEKKLGNEAFKKNAPANVVEAERARQAEYQTTLAKLQGNLAVLAE